MGISHAKNDVMARLIKLAQAAIASNRLDLLERDLARSLVTMPGDMHDAHSGSYT